MKERVKLLDREGLAKAILYPTIGLLWEAELMDAELRRRIAARTTAGSPISAATRAGD